MGLAKRPARSARPRPALAEPAARPAALALLRALSPLYARAALRLDSLELRHGERLIRAFAGFQKGESRLILAFRHAYGDEPQLLSYLFDVLLPREARRLGLALPRRPHARFVHGYEVPLWSGELVRWLLPRVGALPVYHVRFDAASVERLRAAMLDAEGPLALAPEGQISYRSETLPRIEKGAARLAFWCAEDLARSGRAQSVSILPISLHYRYDESGIGELERLAGRLEGACGLAAPPPAPRPASPDGRRAALKSRILRIEAALLGLAESYYGLGRPASPDGEDWEAAGREERDERRGRLLEAALSRGEAMLGLAPPAGPAEVADRIGRVYRIRQEGWDRIYPTSPLGAMGELERALADRRAGEAWYAMRHMELVDLGHYLDSGYLEGGAAGPAGAPSFGRLVEAAYSLADLASRLVGGDISDRPNLLRKRAVVVVAPPLDMGARYADYKANRKAAVDAATGELEKAYLACIEEYLHE